VSVSIRLRPAHRTVPQGARAVAVCLAALLCSCAGPRTSSFPQDSDGGYPGELRGAAALGAEVLWRQSVTARWEAGEATFDAAVQVLGDQFLVVGLSPLGQPGFVLRLEGGAITVENHSGRELELPPQYVLLDVQRALFPWIEGPPPRDGERTAERFGERIVERYVAGQLVERRFERLDGSPPGVIAVHCDWSSGFELAPRSLRLDNGWYGYSLEVRTLEETRLPSAAGGGD
jgi:hypothetical protein